MCVLGDAVHCEQAQRAGTSIPWPRRRKRTRSCSGSEANIPFKSVEDRETLTIAMRMHQALGGEGPEEAEQEQEDG